MRVERQGLGNTRSAGGGERGSHSSSCRGVQVRRAHVTRRKIHTSSFETEPTHRDEPRHADADVHARAVEVLPTFVAFPVSGRHFGAIFRKKTSIVKTKNTYIIKQNKQHTRSHTLQGRLLAPLPLSNVQKICTKQLLLTFTARRRSRSDIFAFSRVAAKKSLVFLDASLSRDAAVRFTQSRTPIPWRTPRRLKCLNAAHDVHVDDPAAPSTVPLLMQYKFPSLQSLLESVEAEHAPIMWQLLPPNPASHDVHVHEPVVPPTVPPLMQ